MNAKSAVTNIFVEASMSGKVSMYLFHGRYRTLSWKGINMVNDAFWVLIMTTFVVAAAIHPSPQTTGLAS